METLSGVRPCVICQTLFTAPPNNNRAMYCGPRCREAGRPSRQTTCACGNKMFRTATSCRLCMNTNRYPRCREVSTQTKEQRAQHKMQSLLLTSMPNRQPRTFKAVTCTVCATQFITLNVDVTCSATCQALHKAAMRREGKHKRRAIEKMAYVSPVYRLAIYARDNWTCGLCQGPIDRTARAPEALSASIDHVVPLSKGGTHEPSNVQAAHFLCNARKGDRH